MIILFGLAGSGKGTQGQALARLFDWQWVSNGEVIRRSHKYDDIINQGKLIPDQDVIDMMNAEIQRLQAVGHNIILDGYPRDVTQAQYLIQHFSDQIDGAIILDVPKDELYKRLALRGRDDDHSKTSIDNRFAVFEQNIYPILHLLEQYHIPTKHVDGVGEVETVTARLVNVVQQLVPSAQLVQNPAPPSADPTQLSTDPAQPATEPAQSPSEPTSSLADPSQPSSVLN